MPGRSPRLIQGIGDDGAVVKAGAGRALVVTTDLLVEGIHFLRELSTPYLLGWKALGVNLSDLAAMGCRPEFYTVNLALPDSVTEPYVRELYRGMKRLGDRHGVVLVGGDLSSSMTGLMVSVTAWGHARRRALVYRHGARPGDLIYVSGDLGGSATGLDALKALGDRRRRQVLRAAERAQPPRGRGRWILEAVTKHLAPQPRVGLGAWLGERGLATSLIDLSDGLSSDLLRICEASGVGARLDEAAIPMAESCRRLSRDPLRDALHGGEDYELLFTVSPSKERALRRFPGLRFSPLRKIGTIERGRRRIRLRTAEGESLPLKPGGYDHFRAAEPA